jgi:glycosyltransferase involved in cell wall biosynthesis
MGSMHTLLIHQAFAAESDPGGTRHLELARRAVAAGEKFTIVASDVPYGSGKRVTPRRRLMTEEQIDGIRLVRCYTPAFLHRSYLWRVLAFLTFMITSTIAGLKVGPVDLVMGTSPPIFQAVSAWAVAFLRRKPFLLEIRDLWPEFAIDIGVLTNPVLIALSRWLEKFLYRRAAHLLVNSPAYRGYLISKGVPDAKVSLISNGVEPGMFDPLDCGDSVRREFNLSGKFVVTYTGALGMANDIDTLIRAAEHLRRTANIHFLLVGGGKELERLQSDVSNRGLTNVMFTGPQPKNRVPAFLAASDACVALLKNIPMFRTTYPNKVFDYMAAGRPTVLAIDGVIREVIEAAHGGIYVSPGDDTAIADAICTLSGNPLLSNQMGKAARDYVVTHFNRRDQAQSFLQLLRSFTVEAAPVGAED